MIIVYQTIESMDPHRKTSWVCVVYSEVTVVTIYVYLRDLRLYVVQMQGPFLLRQLVCPSFFDTAFRGLKP